MLEEIDDVIVDGVSMAQYCTAIHFGYHKVWGKDTGRNNGGDNSGTLLGIYPKITFTFRKLNKKDTGELLRLFNKAENLLTFFNPDLEKKIYNMSCYSNDQEFDQKYLGKIQEYKSSVISNRKREYYA